MKLSQADWADKDERGFDHSLTSAARLKAGGVRDLGLGSSVGRAARKVSDVTLMPTHARCEHSGNIHGILRASRCV